MKSRLLLPLVLAAAVPVFGQEAAPAPAPSPSPAGEAAPAAETGDSLLDPLPALPGPADAPMLPAESGPGFELPRLKTEPTPAPGEAEDETGFKKSEQIKATIEERVKFRKARTKALADAKVMEAASRVEAATTDPEKRAALEAYYGALFAKVRQLDPTLEPILVAAQEQVARRLDPVTAREQDIKERAEKKQAARAAAGASPSPSPAAR